MSRALVRSSRRFLNILRSSVLRNYSYYAPFKKSNLKLAGLFKTDFLVHRRFLNTNTCWNCGTAKKDLNIVFCEECNIVQNPYETSNFFKIFDLDEKFEIDQEVLKDRYRKLQNALHPDRFTNKTEQEKNISADYSSLINKAYSNLLTPMKRAEHLLELKGENIAESQKIDDPEFLMEMMKLNEEVENADPKKLQELNIKNKNKLETITKEIDKYFKNNDIENAKRAIIIMKYYHSLSNRINNTLRELGIVDE